MLQDSIQLLQLGDNRPIDRTAYGERTNRAFDAQPKRARTLQLFRQRTEHVRHWRKRLH
jgi:hypothetical protein